MFQSVDFISIYVKVNANVDKLYTKSWKTAIISIIWTLYRYAYIKTQSFFIWIGSFPNILLPHSLSFTAFPISELATLGMM